MKKELRLYKLPHQDYNNEGVLENGDSAFFIWRLKATQIPHHFENPERCQDIKASYRHELNSCFDVKNKIDQIGIHTTMARKSRSKSSRTRNDVKKILTLQTGLNGMKNIKHGRSVMRWAFRALRRTHGPYYVLQNCDEETSETSRRWLKGKKHDIVESNGTVCYGNLQPYIIKTLYWYGRSPTKLSRITRVVSVMLAVFLVPMHWFVYLSLRIVHRSNTCGHYWRMALAISQQEWEMVVTYFFTSKYVCCVYATFQ